MKYSGIGGQAVIEGIMMKNKDDYAVAVRKPDGQIEVQTDRYVSMTEKVKFFSLPFIRGVFSFADSMILGMRALTFSTSFFEDDEDSSPSRFELWLDKVFGEKLEKVLMAAVMAFSVVAAVGIFMILPLALSSLLRPWITSDTLMAFLEGVLRLAIFILYIKLVSNMEDIRRTFMYHGAEHKTINCVENGLDLTVENVRTQSRYHRRCGTSFLLVVMIVSIIFFMFIRIDNLWLRMLYRILLIPVVAGVSFEFIQFVGNSDNPVVLFFGKPGMWLQKLTTREPDDGMIEVAIASVEAVFDWRAYQAGIRKELSRRKRHKKHREREEKKVIPEDIVQDADYEQSFAAPDPETSMELSAEDEKAFDRPQESKKAEKASTAKKSKAEEEAKEERTSVAKKKSRTEKAEKSSTAKKPKAEEEAKEEKTSATEKKTVAKEEKVFAVSEKETEAAVREEKAVRKESRKSDRRPAKKKSIFDKLPRSKKRRELEEREARYRNRAAERMRQIKEQEEREAAHERAYQEARKRTAERIAATQELPKLQLDQDKDELKSLDRFFDDK